MRKTLFLMTLLIAFSYSNVHAQQVELKIIDLDETSLFDVNNSGIAITTDDYYDFETEVLTPMEPGVTVLRAINDLGDVGGGMILDQTAGTTQPAYRHNGIWTPIGWFEDSNPETSSFITHDISNNGRYVVGQMSKGPIVFGIYLYDTTTNTLTEIFDPGEESIAGYTVNDQGIVGGWLDQPDSGGTLRVPAYITPDQTIHLIPSGQFPTISSLNGIYDINNSNVMVGNFDFKAFIYDQPTDTFTTFSEVPEPENYEKTHFLSISENGIAVGFAADFNNNREAIIYHPSLGDQPLLLKDVLINFGIEVDTPTGNLGPAYSISSDGNFVVGKTRGIPWEARGWIVNFNDLLLLENDCSISCPENIVLSTEMGQSSIIVDYTVEFECLDETPPGTELVHISGPLPGDELEFGEYVVNYQLLDADQNIIDYCGFTITVEDYFCVFDFEVGVEPITNVEFLEINNVTSADPNSPPNEYFFDIKATVVQGETYTITLEGFTGGNYTDYFTAHFDWNQNGVFNDPNEVYFLGSITNSTGTDGIQMIDEIVIPEDAMLGTTRMRIVKVWEGAPVEPACGTGSYGQTEDYTIEVLESLGINDKEFVNVNVYPNPATDILNIDSISIIENIVIYNVYGQELVKQEVNTTNPKINIANLSEGVYFVKIMNESSNKIFKIIKK